MSGFTVIGLAISHPIAGETISPPAAAARADPFPAGGGNLPPTVGALAASAAASDDRAPLSGAIGGLLDQERD
ncbi:MAG: hypothetical protein ACK4PC_00715 [Sphingopyxis sp.]